MSQEEASNQKYLRVEDLTGDGGIIKKVIREGNGICPSNGQNVIGN